MIVIISNGTKKLSTLFADTVYLQFMPYGNKIVRLCKLVLQLFYLCVINLDEPTAFHTDEMVMMLLPEFGFISGFLFTDLYLISQAAFTQ